MSLIEKFSHTYVEGARFGRFNHGVNTSFIIYRIGDTLIDSGPSNQWKYVKPFIDEKNVAQLLLTHHHEDHSGNAGRIAKLFDITPYAPTECADKLRTGYRTPIMQKLIWGSPKKVTTRPLPSRINLENGTVLDAFHTPGHAKDLHCFHDAEKGWLFSGDLYISKSLKYLRSDEDLDQLVNSIRLALSKDFDILFCPHRGILEDGKRALQAKLDNILMLCENVQDLHSKGFAHTEITKKLLGPEDAMAFMTRNNFCKGNLVKEALQVAL